MISLFDSFNRPQEQKKMVSKRVNLNFIILSNIKKTYLNMIKFKTNFNLIFLFSTILLIFYSCSNTDEKISLTKVEGSPAYDNSSIEIKDISNEGENFMFSFDINNYDLGAQTKKEFDYNLANSELGQHIHFIVNNGPYSAHYVDNFETKLTADNSVILAFLSRSYHESVKNPNAYILTQIGDTNNVDLENEFIFYSRPKGTYKGSDTEKLLLDFYLVNTDLGPEGNKVKISIIQNEETHDFLVDEWTPFYIEGLDKGEVSITLELLDNDGELIETPFNPSSRTVVLE
jgi:hypothetical protein